MTAGFTFYGIVLIRTVHAVSGARVGTFEVRLLVHALPVVRNPAGMGPAASRRRWHEWAAWVPVIVGLAVLMFDLAVDSLSPGL
jgi:hypothetical protein